MIITDLINNPRSKRALYETSDFAILAAACLSPKFRRYGLPLALTAKAVSSWNNEAFPALYHNEFWRRPPYALDRVVNVSVGAILPIWAAVHIARAIQTWPAEWSMLSLGGKASLVYKKLFFLSPLTLLIFYRARKIYAGERK